MMKANEKVRAEQNKAKAMRYAQTASREPMPRPTVYESRKAYNRQRGKRELSAAVSE